MELKTRISLLARNATDVVMNTLKTRRLEPPKVRPAPNSWPSKALKFSSLPGSQYVRRAARFFRHK